MKLAMFLSLIIVIHSEGLTKGIACPNPKNICDNEGFCLISNHRYIYCSCDSGFTGTFCERTTVDALLIASRTGDTRKVLRLIRVGARTNIQDIEGNSPLILAVQYGYTDTVDALISKEINLEIKDKLGKTALMWASIRGYTMMINSLIKARANKNAQDNSGNTALIWATWYGRQDAVVALITAGANYNIRNYYGKTALSFANFHPAIKDIIKNKGGIL